MNKTKIDWADYTWNTVTGCRHECEYCYARKIANRFSKTGLGKVPNSYTPQEYNKPFIFDGTIDPYPAGFTPTFHQNRLDEPKKLKTPSKIFVVSMGDLFGAWVPDKWIQEVFKACESAPQHTYLFLTKNPKRYSKMAAEGKLPHKNNFWYGSTITGNGELRFVSPRCDNFKYNTFISIEPLLNIWDFNPYGEFDSVKWVIIGAQTGPNAIKPKPEWVQSIINQCRKVNVPIFLKNNLEWPEKIQELPEGL